MYNYFPYTYQNAYQSYPQTQQTSVSGQQSSITWVQGEAGAKSYLVAPNTTVQLWDSEAQVIYLKSADASGMPSMKIIDYTIRDAAPTQSNAVSYVTKDEFDHYKQEIQKMIGGLNNESTVPATKQQPKYGKPNQ
jgi:hypothetical protein